MELKEPKNWKRRVESQAEAVMAGTKDNMNGIRTVIRGINRMMESIDEKCKAQLFAGITVPMPEEK